MNSLRSSDKRISTWKEDFKLSTLYVNRSRSSGNRLLRVDCRTSIASIINGGGNVFMTDGN